MIVLKILQQKKLKKVTYSKKSYISKKTKETLSQTFQNRSYLPSYKILTKNPDLRRKLNSRKKSGDIFITQLRKLKLWSRKNEISNISGPQRKGRMTTLHLKTSVSFRQPFTKNRPKFRKNRLRSLLLGFSERNFSRFWGRSYSPG
jgi:hypothetical protein